MRILLTFFLSCSIVCHAQKLIEKDGKYGLTFSHSWSANQIEHFAPIYDTIVVFEYSYGDHVVNFKKAGQWDVKRVHTSNERFRIHEYATLDISFAYFSKSEWGNSLYQFSVANSSGGTFVHDGNDYVPIPDGQAGISLVKDGKFELRMNGTSVDGLTYDFIRPEIGFFACLKNGMFTLYDLNGELKFPDKVSDYDLDHYDEIVSVEDGEKQGYFFVSSSDYSVLKSNSQPSVYQWLYRDYEGNYGDEGGYPQKVAFPFFKASNKDQYGLVDTKGAEIWPSKYLGVEVTIKDSLFYVLKKTKKDGWEVYSQELELTGNVDFDRFIGMNSRHTIVEKDGKYRALNYDRFILTDITPGKFETYFIPFLNPQGKYGCANIDGSIILEPAYEALNPDVWGILMVATAEGFVALDTNFKQISPEGLFFDYTWRVSGDDNAFVFRKGLEWGWFFLDERPTFGPVELVAGESQFNIDDKAYSKLQDFYVFQKEGKSGVIKNNNEVQIKAEYDHIFRRNYDGKDSYVANKDEIWFLISNDMQSIKQVEAVNFVDFTYNGDPVFLLGDQFVTYSNETQELVEYAGLYRTNDRNIEHALYSDPRSTKGVVAADGKVIIPFNHVDIDIRNYATSHAYIVAQNYDRKYGLFTLKGEQILEYDYSRINGFCHEHTVFFIQKTDGTAAIATWDVKTSKLTYITDWDVESAECMDHLTEEFIGEIVFKDGSKKNLTKDFEIIPQQD